jgi:hypothetical protein
MNSEEATNTWRANPSLLVLLNAAWLAANTHFIVFSLIRLELEPTIYHSLEASQIVEIDIVKMIDDLSGKQHICHVRCASFPTHF